VTSNCLTCWAFVFFFLIGAIAEQGTFTKLNADNKAFAQLIRDFGITDEKEKESKVKKLGQSSENIASSTEDKKKQEDAALLQGNLTGEEGKEVGNIGLRIYWFYVTTGGPIPSTTSAVFSNTFPFRCCIILINVLLLGGFQRFSSLLLHLVV